MHRCRIVLVAVLLAAILSQVSFTATDQMVVQKMSQVPLSFTKNMGQWDDRVLFRANAAGATIWFTREGVTYQFTRRIGSKNTPLSPLSRGDSRSSNGNAQNEPIHLLRGVGSVSDKDSIEQLILTAKLIGANPNPEVVGEGLMEYKCNYFIGNDPSKWQTDVPNYEAITLKDIYPGIDLKHSGDGNGQAAYEFVVAPGADIAQIKVAYEGTEETSIDADGRVILKTKWGDVIAAIKTPTDGVLSGTGSFSQLSEQMIGFEATGALAVGLVYSTFLGGGDPDGGNDIAVDGSGNAYVTGWTASSDFPTQDPYQTDPDPDGGRDAFVAKLSSSGNSLIYSTYLGGGNEDIANSIAVDGSGNACVTGYSYSSDFPTLNPYQTYQGSSDAFVTELSSSGNSLIYSTYLGGGDEDHGDCIAVDVSGNAYVTGLTRSSNFSTLNPYQATNHGSFDAFVTKLSSSGATLIYSTYLGGESYDRGSSIAVDGSGNAYVTGYTDSYNLPTLNPFQTYQGTFDAFVTKLSSSGSSLVYSTFLGGKGGQDQGYDIAIDGNDNAYVTGWTQSYDFPTLNPFQTFQGPYPNGDFFVTKLSSSGSNLVYSTYLGGSGDASTWASGGIAVDGNGQAYVTGRTSSSTFPTLHPYQTHQGYADVFVTKLSRLGAGLIYSTYLGGGGVDYGNGIAVDGNGNAYVTGYTQSSDFPTQNPYQTYQGGADASVTKLTPLEFFCGDADANGMVNISDAVYLIAYIFSSGPAPNPLDAGDIDCNGFVNISDAVYLIAYIFGSGPAPCAGCK